MEFYFLILLVTFSLITLQLATTLLDCNLALERPHEIEDWFMFFASGGEEKTEKPSFKKLQDARKKGQTVKSNDVNNFVMMGACFLIMTTFGPIILEQIQDLMAYFFENSFNVSLLSSNSSRLLMTVLTLCLNIMFLIFVPLLVVGIVANISQTGFLMTSEPLKPQLNKLNPFNGFKEMFSKRRLLGALKNIALLVIAYFLVTSFIQGYQEELMVLPYMHYMESLSVLGEIVGALVTQMLGLVFVIAAVDYMIQRFEFMKGLKMTKQELKEEFKQMEGDPFIKGKRRQKQREIANTRMMQAVSESTVVVTNPTHFAVAIKYDHESDMVPKVMAKGVDFKAQKIKEIAKEHDVPIMENKLLARTLYKTVEVDQEIPLELYKAVAQLLAVVYKLEANKKYY